MSKSFKIKKTTVWQLVSLALLIALVISIVTGGFGSGGNNADDNSGAVPDDGSTAAGSDALTTLTGLAKKVGVDTNKFESCYSSGKYDIKLTTDAAAGQKANIGGTPAFFVNDQLVSGAQSFEAIKTIIDAEIAKANQGTAKAGPTLAADDPVKGNKDAGVTIIVFSDPSCPFCAAAAGAPEMVSYMQSRSPSWQPPVPGIMEEYVDTGKVKIVFKYFPGHGSGKTAMKALWCANEQGKFWELHDLVFANQAAISD